MNGEHSNSPAPPTTDPVTKLDPAFKAKWVEALRSGAYTQTKGRLRSPENGFCCLGVACDLIDRDRWSTEVKYNYGDRGYDWGKRLTGFVDEPLDDAIGVPRGTARMLSKLNDGDKDSGIRRRSFAEIADWIEANL